jgi:hypothetical protein
VLEKLTPYDAGIIAAAAIMALGAFCPLINLPIVGSMNYVAGGRGDGIFVLAAAAAIIVMVMFGYRRLSAVVAAGALLLVMTTLTKFAAMVSKLQADAAHAPKSDLFSGLTSLLAQSFGLEWGWLLLIGGALGAIALALAAPREPRGEVSVGSVLSAVEPDGTFSSADRLIADYIENKKISPAIREKSKSQPSAFGKRLYLK